MQSQSLYPMRFFRFCVWALLMLVAVLVTVHFAPRKALFVPCVFIALMVPMVLLPLEPKRKG